MYSHVGAYISYLCCNHKDRIVYLSVEKQPGDGFAIEHDCIQLPFVHELHCYADLHLSEDDSSNTDADTKNVCIDPEQPPVGTCI